VQKARTSKEESQQVGFINFGRIKMQGSLRTVFGRLMWICILTISLVPVRLSAQGYPAASQQEDQPQYPGIPPANGKLEAAIGSYHLRLYGTVLLNIQASDTPPIGGDVSLWAPPATFRTAFLDGTISRIDDVHDLTFTARQSVFGLMVTPTETSGSEWRPSGRLELDFFGTRPVDSVLPTGRLLNEPRLRIAYFQLSRGPLKITAGQDVTIIAPLDPVSLSHVAVPLGATAGNLWGWLPQLRVDATRKVGTGSLLFQAGVLRPQFADPRLSDLPQTGTSIDLTPGLGERSAQPFYQSRVAYSHSMNGSDVTVGAGAHYGRERIGVDDTLDSWAFAIDYSVPILRRVTWRGEAFVGSNLVPFGGGVLQGVAFLQPVGTEPPAQINRIGAGGGWTELSIAAGSDNKNVFYAGVGDDDPRDRHLLTGTNRSRNAVAWASYFRRIGNNTTVAMEWSNWQLKTRATFGGAPNLQGPSGTANVFNLALAYQF
jgi:hypothetical protein